MTVQQLMAEAHAEGWHTEPEGLPIWDCLECLAEHPVEAQRGVLAAHAEALLMDAEHEHKLDLEVMRADHRASLMNWPPLSPETEKFFGLSRTEPDRDSDNFLEFKLLGLPIWFWILIIVLAAIGGGDDEFRLCISGRECQQ